MSKQLKLLLGLIVSGVSIWLSLRGIEFDKVGDSLGKINWFWMFVYIFPYIVVIGFKVTRWRVLFYPDSRRMGYQPLFSSLMISYMANTVLPARLGEVVRAYVLSRREKIGVARVLSTILLEKILDIITMFIFLLALLPFLKVEDWIKQSALIFGGGVIGAFLVCLLMAARRREAELVIDWFLNKLPQNLATKLRGFVIEILDTLTVLLNFKVSVNMWTQSIILWVFNITLYWFIGFAIGLPLTFEQSVLVMITTNLGMVVPAAPGYVGTFELVITTTLNPFFPDPAQKSLLFSYALLQHVVSFLPVVIIGVFYAWREGLGLGKMDKVKADVTNEEAEQIGVSRPVTKV